MNNYLLKEAKDARNSFENREINDDLLMELYGNYNQINDMNLFVNQAKKIFPNLNCGLASVYIRNKLGKGKIINGRFKGNNHTFLIVDGNVVDITADQYGGPRVYVGELKQPWEIIL